jgi:hypothetical protein
VRKKKKKITAARQTFPQHTAESGAAERANKRLAPEFLSPPILCLSPP